MSRVNRASPGRMSASAQAPRFESPYQPPSSIEDISDDVLQPEWYTVEVWGQTWRVHRPPPRAIYVLGVAMREHAKSTPAIKQQRANAIRDYLTDNIHPEDFERLMLRMMSPDENAEGVMRQMIKAISTVGTSRPFAPWGRFRS